MRLKVFISWSGDCSKDVALALRSWLPRVIQSIEPWVSDTDIVPGTRWSQEISRELSDTKFGIICVTPDNQHAPWLQFEAGALAKTLDSSTYVCPYLVGMAEEDLSGPLAQLHYVRADREGTFKLLEAANVALESAGLNALDGHQLSDAFGVWWPSLEERLANLPASTFPASPTRSQQEMVEEILEIVRTFARAERGRTHSPAIFRASDDLVPQYANGDRVEHPKFGSGTIVGMRGSAKAQEVTVKFDSVGAKRLLLAHANLEPLPQE